MPQDRAHRVHQIRDRMRSNPATALVLRVVVIAVGLAVIAAGIAMLVLPGPGIAAILLGLAILGSEFPWAKRVVDRVLVVLRRWRDAVVGRYRSRQG